MGEEEENSEHITPAVAPVASLASLPDELLLNIVTHLKGRNDVETIQNYSTFRRLGRKFNSLFTNPSDSLGHYSAGMNTAGRLTKQLHAGVYPREGLSDVLDFLPHEIRGLSAADQLTQIAPVFDLLPSSVQSDIVCDISDLRGDAQSSAVLVMCGHLGKFHDKENVATITMAAVRYLTENGDMDLLSRNDGAKAVALAYEDLSPFLMKRLRGKLTARAELSPLLAGAIVHQNPDILKDAPVREFVHGAMPRMNDRDRKMAAAKLLNHFDDFAPSTRSELIDDAIGHLMQSTPLPDGVGEDYRLHYYDTDKEICSNLARRQSHLTRVNSQHLERLQSSHPELDRIWHAASTQDPAERQSANPPTPHAGLIPLGTQFKALGGVLALQDFERVAGAHEIAKATAGEAKIAREGTARSRQRESGRSG